MLSKLKGQLEEMKSKVQFLGLVKKYLQVSHPAVPLPRVSCGYNLGSVIKTNADC